MPRHLATYQRLVRATWQLKRWQEGEDWSRRLLQADPGNAVAWRSLAFAVEYKGMQRGAGNVGNVRLKVTLWAGYPQRA
ncbi:MAG: hypothetical protein IPK16_05030 [Anaerolineales bacterium]|nr:hypothetical protein [Anaerolineales bacterium]